MTHLGERSNIDRKEGARGKKKKEKAGKEAPAQLRLIAEEIRQGLWGQQGPYEADDDEYHCDGKDEEEWHGREVPAGKTEESEHLGSAAVVVAQEERHEQRSLEHQIKNESHNQSTKGGSDAAESELDERDAEAERAQARTASSRGGKRSAEADVASDQGNEASQQRTEKKNKEKKKEQTRRRSKHEEEDDEFVGAPGRWVEVESPKVKVTLLPYGVAECNYVQGQLETCQLEGCHSGRPYPECHQVPRLRVRQPESSG